MTSRIKGNRMFMNEKEELKAELIRDLSRRYGELVGGDVLRRLLGYQTMAAFRQAIKRKTLNLPTFFMEGRRGRYALTVDIAEWMSTTKTEAMTRADKPPCSNLLKK